MIKITKTISYILKFIYSARLMASSLSNLVNNLSERVHRIKCKYGHNDKKWETCRIKYKYCNCFLEHKWFNKVKYKCLYCNKDYQHKFDEKLKEQYFNTYKFSNHDNKRFKSKKQNVFTEDIKWINNNALSSNDDKRMQSIDSVET